MKETAKHIIFSGPVQGIGFRFTAFNIANRYNLTGIVRNLLNGDVEMVVQGNQDDIDFCVSEIRDAFEGYVRDVKFDEIPVNPNYTDFKITF